VVMVIVADSTENCPPLFEMNID